MNYYPYYKETLLLIIKLIDHNITSIKHWTISININYW